VGRTPPAPFALRLAARALAGRDGDVPTVRTSTHVYRLANWQPAITQHIPSRTVPLRWADLAVALQALANEAAQYSQYPSGSLLSAIQPPATPTPQDARQVPASTHAPRVVR
jgi:hypothetical protein